MATSQNDHTELAATNLAEAKTLDGQTYDVRLINVVLAMTPVWEKPLYNAECYDE